jgi:long-subunit acyl-CoA synthetase (AMP-forming)
MSSGPGSGPVSVKVGANLAHPAGPALVLNTSGSTGTSKGTVLKHEGILANIKGNTREFRIGPGDISP